MIFTLTGPNSYALKQKLEELKTSFMKDNINAEIEIRSGEDLVAEDLASLLQGITLFSSSRLIILEGASRNKEITEKFTSMLSLIPDETTVIFVEPQIDKRTTFYKVLKKETEFHEFLELDEFAAAQWVSDMVKKEGGSISSHDAKLLVRFVGKDQQRLYNEIEKLTVYSPSVTKETITELVERSPEDTIFQLLEYALSGKIKQAVAVLGNLERAHEDPFQAANMLIWQTHILAVTASAEGRTDAEIARDHKISPYVIKKTRVLTKQTSRSTLRYIIKSTAELDETLKSSAVDPWRILEATILSFKGGY